VLDVVQRLIEEVGDVRVVQRVDDLATSPLADNEPQVTEQTQLVRDRRRLHANRLGERVYRAGSLAQTTENPDAARRSKRLHRLGNLLGGSRVDGRRSRTSINAVGHPGMIAEALFRYSWIASAVGAYSEQLRVPSRALAIDPREATQRLFERLFVSFLTLDVIAGVARGR